MERAYDAIAPLDDKLNIDLVDETAREASPIEY